MLSKIRPFYDPKNLCIENIYVSICDALGRNYKNIYAYAWNFGYIRANNLKDEALFGKRIMPSRDGQGLNTEENYALEMYCGIKPIWHINCEFENFIDIVKKELECNRPVVLGTDIFFCNWHKASKKYHSIHYCLVIGINKKGFICIDDTLASTDGNLILEERPESVLLDFDTLKKFNYGFITFQISPSAPEYSSDEVVYLAALKSLTGFNGKSDYDNIRELIVDIDEYLDINKEIQGFEDVWAVDLIRCFNYIVWSRNNFCIFLNDKQKYKGLDIKPIVDKLMDSMNLWEGIKNYTMKYGIDPKSKFNKGLICDNLNEIIMIEEAVAHEIVNAK